VGGYAATAVLSGLIGVAGAAWQVGVLRAGAWTSRGLRVPARNALLADVVPKVAYGRACGFERAMDNLGAIGGPLLAIRSTTAPRARERQPIRLRLRPVMRGELRRLMVAIGAFEFGNLAATLMILRATNLLQTSPDALECRAAGARPVHRLQRGSNTREHSGRPGR
jgi:hypothetical protein